MSPREIVRSGLCIGCGGCASREPTATMKWDRDGFLKPDGPAEWLERPSAQLAKVCPFSPAAANEDQIAAERFASAPAADEKIGRFEAAFVGHVAEGEYRLRASSGGLATWVAAELLRSGRIDGVAHVVPVDDPQANSRFFHYRVSRSIDQVREGAKSRYYPVELSGVLREMRERPGRYAVVGVPCFIKAVHLLRRNDRLLRERITHTIGIFCGHQKSAHMAVSFAAQAGADIARVEAIDYRLKDPSRPANWYRAHFDLSDGSSRAKDWWHLADGDWGAGFFQNPACDWCDDVVAETADIAFGDAWVEPYSSDGRGTNVAVVRSRELLAMLEQGIDRGLLALDRVDAAFVEATQAAGFRHRREGLAYRLTWRKPGLRPRKRVLPNAAIPFRRRLIYRARRTIARTSLTLFRTAQRLGSMRIYTLWAKATLRAYQALAWSRGRLGRLFDRIFGPARG